MLNPNSDFISLFLSHSIRLSWPNFQYCGHWDVCFKLLIWLKLSWLCISLKNITALSQCCCSQYESLTPEKSLVIRLWNQLYSHFYFYWSRRPPPGPIVHSSIIHKSTTEMISYVWIYFQTYVEHTVSAFFVIKAFPQKWMKIFFKSPVWPWLR